MNSPLTKGQLNYEPRCPIHGIETDMSEYGNPDSLRECSECEAEMFELNREIERLEQGLLNEFGPDFATLDFGRCQIMQYRQKPLGVDPNDYSAPIGVWADKRDGLAIYYEYRVNKKTGQPRKWRIVKEVQA